MKKEIKIDRINRKILVELQDNARISNLDLAERVALSPSACLKRTKLLERTGAIRNYVMAADLDKICFSVQAYFLISMEDHKLETLESYEKFINDVPEIVDCLKVSGSLDFIAFVVCTSVELLNTLSDRLLRAEIGIRRIDTHVIMARPKWFAGYPLKDLTWKEEIQS